MAIVLLRHAPLAIEYQDRHNGWSDIDIDISLFEKSRCSDILDREFDYIYSSDLKRCVHTLELLGFDNIIQDESLREVRFKEHIEGKSFEEISKRDDFKESYLDSIESWHNYIADESLEEFEGRIESFLSKIDRDSDTLICTHAGVIYKIYEILDIKLDKRVDYLDSIYLLLQN